jgi:hypothetical protein
MMVPSVGNKPKEYTSNNIVPLENSASYNEHDYGVHNQTIGMLTVDFRGTAPRISPSGRKLKPGSRSAIAGRNNSPRCSISSSWMWHAISTIPSGRISASRA